MSEQPEVLASPRSLVISEAEAGERLDVFLPAAAPGSSRSEWRRSIDAGLVSVRGTPARGSLRLKAGDTVEVQPGSVIANPAISAEPVPFAVVYEDAAMVVLDKPPGVVVHPAPGNAHGTLVHGLLARYPEMAAQVDPRGVSRPGIVHRLDKDTSGLLVVGRTPAATAELQRQLRAREVDKRYLVLVVGGIRENEGLIDAPVSRDPRYRQRMAARAEGRPSQTAFRVLERFGDFTLLEAHLLTGRTHQIRVHFAFIGHPVAGDRTYGAAPRGVRLPRQFLHAHGLQVVSPADGQPHTFTSALPPDLAAVLEALRRRAGSR